MIRRVDVLGVGVSAIDMPMALDEVERWIVVASVSTSASPGSMASWKPA
jgi:hypothetical protein